MIEQLLFGSGFAFAAAVQPGPLQAFLLSQVVQKGWKRTLPASLAPLLSDGPVIVLSLLILKRMPDGMDRILQVAGGLLLLYLAWASYLQYRKSGALRDGKEAGTPRTLLQAAAVNILNPNPYLAWTVVLGPRLLNAWAQGHALAIALIAAFYGTMVISLSVIIVLFGATHFLGPQGRRALVLVSSFLLAALGFYQLAAGFRHPL